MKKNIHDKTKIVGGDQIEVVTKDTKKKKNVNELDPIIEEKKTTPVDDLEENLVEKYKNYKILDIQAFKNFLVKTKDFLFGVTLEKSGYIEVNKKKIKEQIKIPIKFGLFAIAVTLSFFVVWSAFAPLDSASIAEGFVKLSENRKVIQHYEGGIVKKILVKDGDEVKKGQKLIILNEARTKSDLERTLWQLRYAIAIDKRLIKSLEMISIYQKSNDIDKLANIKVDFDNKYLDQSDPKITALMTAQENSFNSYKDFIRNNIETFTTQIAQEVARMHSLKERIKSYKENISTYKEEYERKKNLYKKQLETSERLSNVKIELQRYVGQVAEDEANLASLEHKLVEIKMRHASFMDEQNVRLSEEYKRNHTELLTLEAQYIHAKDAYERVIITAPNAGIVTDLQVHTIGGTIQPSGKIMEIIPQDDSLIIEAFIPAHEIDSIHINSPVKIQLNAYKARLVPRIEGTVKYISADKFDKETHGMVQPGQPKFTPAGYYKARIEVSPKELDKVNTEIKLYPGMPVTVFIIKGTRSFAEYLYSPIKDSFHRAFKEP